MRVTRDQKPIKCNPREGGGEGRNSRKLWEMVVGYLKGLLRDALGRSGDVSLSHMTSTTSLRISTAFSPDFVRDRACGACSSPRTMFRLVQAINDTLPHATAPRDAQNAQTPRDAGWASWFALRRGCSDVYLKPNYS